MKLQGKAALITGGTSGIGLETAKLFLEEGAKVAIVGSNAERLAAAAEILGDRALPLLADVREIVEIERAIAEIEVKFGRLDIVFANAGAGTVVPFEAITLQHVVDNFALNFNGVLFTIQKAIPHMTDGGSVIVTTSFLNEVGMPGLSMLAATKAATRSLVRSLGAELAGRNIRVNAVSPGAISTPFYGKIGLSDAELDSVAASLQEKIPLKRFGYPIELAKAALYLASEDSSYMTGIELVVDGGLTQI